MWAAQCEEEKEVTRWEETREDSWEEQWGKMWEEKWEDMWEQKKKKNGERKMTDTQINVRCSVQIASTSTYAYTM